MPPRYRKPHLPKFSRITRKFAAIANDILGAEVDAFAETEAARFKRDIERQVFPSFRRHPLKVTYFKRKKQLGLDPRIMIATAWYKEHIRVWAWRPPRTNPRTTRGYRIGFHPRVQARDYRGRIVPILLNKLALIHEHGSADQHIPPRAHWEPHRRAMVRRAVPLRERIRRLIIKQAKKSLARFA